MNKDIKVIMSKESLTGDDAGRLMILDLIEAYKDLSEGGEGKGVLSDEEKINIVNSLTFSDDIQRFNDFRGVHDFLTTVPAIYESYAKTYEVYYWKLFSLLTEMKYAEDENSLRELSPVVMTKKQYEKFIESGSPAPAGGVAVLQGDPQTCANIDENGFYSKPQPECRTRRMAEYVLENQAGYIKENLDGMKDMLAECMARRKALELIARYIKIPGVKLFITAPDEKKLLLFNEFMESVVNSVSRCRDKEYENRLRAELSALLTPIDVEALKPSAQAVTKARRHLNFSVIKNGSEAFIAALKRKWRDDC